MNQATLEGVGLDRMSHKSVKYFSGGERKQ